MMGQDDIPIKIPIGHRPKEADLSETKINNLEVETLTFQKYQPSAASSELL